MNTFLTVFGLFFPKLGMGGNYWLLNVGWGQYSVLFHAALHRAKIQPKSCRCVSLSMKTGGKWFRILPSVHSSLHIKYQAINHTQTHFISIISWLHSSVLKCSQCMNLPLIRCLKPHTVQQKLLGPLADFAGHPDSLACFGKFSARYCLQWGIAFHSFPFCHNLLARVTKRHKSRELPACLIVGQRHPSLPSWGGVLVGYCVSV